MTSRKISQRSVTMRDVATLAGVSQSTVSRVLSQTESSIPISEDTYRKVYDAIKTLGYHPNATARALRTQRTNMIAVMISDISNSFYHTITRTIQDIATQKNYDVLIANTDHIYEYEKRFCEAMMRRPVDGIIMIPFHLTEHDVEQLILRTGAAVVVLSRQMNHPQIDLVSGDDGKATYDTVRWLIEKKGHRHIGYIAVANTGPGERRLAAYRRAVQESGLPEYVDYGNWTVESGEAATYRMRMMMPLPGAILACNDHMAIGVLNAALDSGLRVPADLAIVGFDDVPATTFVRPKLTTIAQHPAAMGTRLANLLFDRIEHGYEGPSRVYQVVLDLIERDTT